MCSSLYVHVFCLCADFRICFFSVALSHDFKATYLIN